MIQLAKEREEKPKSNDDEEKGNESEAETQKDEAKEDYAQMREHLLRIAAEFDNYKKRVKKEIDYAQNMGKAQLIKDLLPIIDEFELAMLAIDGSDDKVVKGMEMLYSNFTDTLKKEGLSIIDCKGVFDPYKHEIMMLRESDKKEGTILEVVKKGYMFEDKMLRPAAVVVAKPKESEENKITE